MSEEQKENESILRKWSHEPIPEPALIDAIKEHRGNVSAIVRAFGTSRGKVTRAIEASPAAKTAMASARETILDQAESVLFDRALAGRTKELLFFLKTQGRRRGYSERNLTLNIDITNMDDEELQAILDL
jgi:hypothetical protein